MEDEEDDGDTDLERQNVEELYDSVRHQHQRDVQGDGLDVQHESLVPVLRPYQSQAVNWMLWREKYNNSASESKAKGESVLLLARHTYTKFLHLHRLFGL